jgi:hypothetical protein
MKYLSEEECHCYQCRLGDRELTKREIVLAMFTVEDLENEVTKQSITEKLEQLDKCLI